MNQVNQGCCPVVAWRWPAVQTAQQTDDTPMSEEMYVEQQTVDMPMPEAMHMHTVDMPTPMQTVKRRTRPPPTVWVPPAD